jgi:N-acetyl-anhydromuramyl-L-alanine amidase AmpD
MILVMILKISNNAYWKGSDNMSIIIINPKLTFRGTFTENKPEAIILHHALHNKCTIQDVHKWHLNNGWNGFSYHFFICKDGKIYKGREINHNGGHTQGMNTKSIGICLEGCYTDYTTKSGVNMTEKTVPQAQYNAVVALTKYLMKQYNLRKIFPHSQYNKTKDCPGKYFTFGRYLADCFSKQPIEEKTNNPHLWKESLAKRTDFPDRWENGLLKVWELIGTYPELEIFRFFPDLIEKYEKLVK